ncbi:hypothetical protein [Streptomyces sp. NPDC127190]|uniref:hypothetical protein n=1 Tax=unclassified Streptomyces TaxID=2593676 RepID=UPI00363FC310
MLTDDTTGAAQPADPDQSDPELHRFVTLSMPLTGFAGYDLYGTGMARLYLDTVRGQVGASHLAEFLDAWQQALAYDDPPARLTPLHREIARAVTYLWYTGGWPRLAPAAHAALRREVPNTEFVASPSSYPEGLVWRSFAGHPAGAKPPGFGTWAAEPARLPTEQEIRDELRSAATDPGTADALALTAYDAGLPADSVPAHLLPGSRLSRAVAPSAVPAAAAPPATEPEEASE